MSTSRQPRHSSTISQHYARMPRRKPHRHHQKFQDHTFHNFVVLGRKGTGKTTLIQTLLSILSPDDQGQPLEEPRMYHSPGSHFGLWDTPAFDPKIGETCLEFLNRIRFYNYDFYIITSSNETETGFEKAVINRILEQKKGYFFVYTKVDLFLQHKQLIEPKTSSEVALKELQAQINPMLKESMLFLINCHQPDEFDFPNLQALLPEAARSVGSGWSQPGQKTQGDQKVFSPNLVNFSFKGMEGKGQAGQPEARPQKHDDQAEGKSGKGKGEESYNVAIVGKSGAGKSTLINAYFRLSPDLPEAAACGVVETTREPMPFHLPGSALILWDTPGFGTPSQPEDSTYFDRVHFDNYDFYILVSASKVNEFEREVCHRILSQNKSYFYVRTRMEQALKGERMAHPLTYNEEEVMKNIQQKIREDLPLSPMFLVDSRQPGSFDFPDLQALAPLAARNSRQACLDAERASRASRNAQLGHPAPRMFCVIT